MTDSPLGEPVPSHAIGGQPAETAEPPEGAAGERAEAGDDADQPAERAAARRRRRGSRGGRGRSARARRDGDDIDDDSGADEDDAGERKPGERDDRDSAGEVREVRDRPGGMTPRRTIEGRVRGGAAASSRASIEGDSRNPELPDVPREGKADPEAAAAALVRRPQIGDTRPAPVQRPAAPAAERAGAGEVRKRRRGGRGRSAAGPSTAGQQAGGDVAGNAPGGGRTPRPSKSSAGTGTTARGRQGRSKSVPVEAIMPTGPIELDAKTLERRRGRERNGRPIGRYLMCVHVRSDLTQIAVVEGRNLIEHYVSRPADDVGQIHGNIYMGRVQNVLPGMEAAFVDIATPKNAVLYRGDVTYDAEDVESKAKVSELRIEQMLRPKQLIICQVTKNPIGAKGARLTQEVSLPGRFVVLIPNSKTYGISKRLPDDERKRLRSILDKVKPAQHGVIVRTAAENVVADELRADVERLVRQWEQVEVLAARTNQAKLLYREPGIAVRVIREEFNAEYRGVIIDDRALYEEVRDYVGSLNPALVDRIEHYDADREGLPLFEKFHVHEQLHKALDRKVWLPSGGSLIIEHAEALTVIDVNTGKNVGTTNLEETVFKNNLEAANEIARQLRLRDIGGIIVIDFIDMEIKENRHKVVSAFREALARDKTRTQVFDISELGLVEMTRKRIGEGLLTAFASTCPTCEGRGVTVDHSLID